MTSSVTSGLANMGFGGVWLVMSVLIFFAMFTGKENRRPTQRSKGKKR